MTTEEIELAEEHMALGRDFADRAKLWAKLRDTAEERRMYTAAVEWAEKALTLRPLHVETATQAMEWAGLAGDATRVEAIRNRFRAMMLGETVPAPAVTAPADPA